MGRSQPLGPLMDELDEHGNCVSVGCVDVDMITHFKLQGGRRCRSGNLVARRHVPQLPRISNEGVQTPIVQLARVVHCGTEIEVASASHSQQHNGGIQSAV